MIRVLWGTTLSFVWCLDDSISNVAASRMRDTFPNEVDEGSTNHLSLVFSGVEAYKCCRYQKLHFAQRIGRLRVSVHALSLSPQAVSGPSVN